MRRATPDWPAVFARRPRPGGGRRGRRGRRPRATRLDGARPTGAVGARRLSWFVSSYPLLGALAAGIDARRRRRAGPRAAGSPSPPSTRRPARSTSTRCARFDDEEWRFVLAHEMLHAALRHGDRGRRPRPVPVERRLRLRDQRLAARDGRRRHARRAAVRPGAGRAVAPRRSTTASPPTCAGCGSSPRCAAAASATSSAAPLGPRRRPRRPRRVLPPRASATGLGLPPAAGPRPPAGRAGARRSARSTTRRCRGTRSWPAGSTSTCRRPEPRRTYARPSRRQASTPDIPRPGRGCGRRRSVGRPPSAWCWTPPARWTASCSARRSARSPPTPRPATCPAARVVFCDAAAVRRRLPAGRRHRRAGSGCAAAAARSCSPASSLLERADDFPTDAPDPGHHRRLVRRAPDPPRARLPRATGRSAAVPATRADLLHAVTLSWH